MAKQRAGKPTPSFSLGKAHTIIAPTAGHLVQVAHDLDLETVYLQDVLLTGIGIGVGLGGNETGIGVGGLVTDRGDIALFYQPADGLYIPAGIVGHTIFIGIVQVGSFLVPVAAESHKAAGGDLWAYYLYLTTLIHRDPQYTRQMAEQVEQITAQNMETAWNVARQGGYEDVSLLATQEFEQIFVLKK